VLEHRRWWRCRLAPCVTSEPEQKHRAEEHRKSATKESTKTESKQHESIQKSLSGIDRTLKNRDRSYEKKEKNKNENRGFKIKIPVGTGKIEAFIFTSKHKNYITNFSVHVISLRNTKTNLRWKG
jgi:sorbitol-specific phosphotransferase system component IIBC